MAKINFEVKDYGLTTIGVRGQVVIPKKIRSALKIKTGEQFLVLVNNKQAIVLIKAENFAKIVKEMTIKLKDLVK
jgi:AbrB family looped-hinge helix DNA binding protein